MTLKKVMTTSSILVATLWMAMVGGCGGTQLPEIDDPDFQGDNLNAEGSQGSVPDSEPASPDKEDTQVTLCHIPPGNPARAHPLTVGQPAVKAHLKHGDTLGACEGTDAGTPDEDGGTAEPDAGNPDPQPDAGTGAPDAGTVCAPAGFECGAGTPCCNGLQCSEGICTIILN
ncbi:MAG TPA: hypothetical protein VE057_09405 [Archangium sp.]|nr:hypothetical protein [Archangium sp.]